MTGDALLSRAKAVGCPGAGRWGRTVLDALVAVLTLYEMGAVCLGKRRSTGAARKQHAAAASSI